MPRTNGARARLHRRAARIFRVAFTESDKSDRANGPGHAFARARAAAGEAGERRAR